MSLLRNCQVRPLETIRGRSIEIREHLHSRAYNGPNTRYTLTKLAADLYANILEWGLTEPTWRYTRYDRYQLQERLPYHCSQIDLSKYTSKGQAIIHSQNGCNDRALLSIGYMGVRATLVYVVSIQLLMGDQATKRKVSSTLHATSETGDVSRLYFQERRS